MQTLQLAPYLSFDGNCREAIEFYQQCLGGELRMQTFGEAPVDMPADQQDRIMHAMLASNHVTLMASDAMSESLTVGNNVSLCLNCGSDEEIERLFAGLGEGGTVSDPLAVQFWGDKFGALTDRFGTRWLLNYSQAAAQ